MIYYSRQNRKSENAWCYVFLLAGVCSLVASRLVSSYQWIFELVTIVSATCFAYLFVRYNNKYIYELKKTRENAEETWELLVYKQVGKREPKTEARFYLSDLEEYGKNPGTHFERVQWEKKNGNPVMYRYVSHLRRGEETILFFKNDGFGVVGIVIDGFDFLPMLASITASKDENSNKS